MLAAQEYHSSKSDKINLAGIAKNIIREFKKTYLVEIEVQNSSGGLGKIIFPSLGKSASFSDRLYSVKMRTVIEGEPVTYKVFRDGHIEFENYWTNPEYDSFFRGVNSLIYG